MFNFDVPRYEKVVGDAIALRPQIEKAVDEICKDGYSNIFFIGCGGTYAHTLPMKYWFDTTSEIETHSWYQDIRDAQKIQYVYSLQEVEIQKRL